MRLSDFTYALPEKSIAITPPQIRGSSKLLVINKNSGDYTDALYADIASYLEPGDLLVLNNTKVFKARLIAAKDNGAKRELIILEKHGQSDDWHSHNVMYRGRLREGERLHIGNAMVVVENILGDGLAAVSSSQNLLELADRYGEVPLPPYMHRAANPTDTERYQTVWANRNGSVAAPTASLNMTDQILDSLRTRGVGIEYLTLHVGLGTFLPMRTETIEEHHMHQEYYEIPTRTVAAVQAAKAANKRVVALGTTVARTLEHSNQAFDFAPQNLSGEADIFIYPGYSFKIVDALLTNFHAPKSTVLMLTAAFAGWDLLRSAYEHAIIAQYRFLSYGDSTLII